MKTTRITIMLFLFVLVTASHAGIYRNQPADDNETADPSSTLYGNSSGSSEESLGLFRSSSASNPVNRPGNGGGIGQSTPIGDGVIILIVCCLLMVGVKVYNERRKKQIENKNNLEEQQKSIV